MMKNNAIILLSGGLDSLVSLAITKKSHNIKKAIYFEYNQTPKNKEFFACKKICEFYNIELEIINIDWLGNISKNSALTNNKAENKKSINYWIPNRNGLFVNIGACYAEALNCENVIIGANLEEAQGFKDNTKEFTDAATALFEYSTNNNVKLIAPLINFTKSQIVQKAIELNTPLEFIWSCYKEGEKHCGVCPSCQFLKKALEENNKIDLQKLLF